MNGLSRTWARLNERYAALSRRERMLLALGVILGPFMLFKALLVDPMAGRSKLLQDSIARQSSTLAEMQGQLTSLQQKEKADPDTARRAEVAALLAEREKLDTQIRQYGSALVPPEEMNALLERLLARQPGLRLLSLKTLAPQGLSQSSGDPAKTSAGKDKPMFDLYRHGVEIRLQGNYNELLAYVLQLEKLDRRLLWGGLQYKVKEYPGAEMSLTVYTLSPEKTWLAF